MSKPYRQLPNPEGGPLRNVGAGNASTPSAGQVATDVLKAIAPNGPLSKLAAAPAAGTAPVDYGTITNTDPFGYVAAAQNAGNRNYANTLAQQNQVENAAGLDYGYSLTRDPLTGAPTVGAQLTPELDPFSKAAILQQSYETAQRRNTNSFASSGQLHSGSYLNAQGYATHDYSQGQDALSKSLTALLQNSEIAKGNAYNQSLDQVGQARTQTLQQLLGLSPDQLVQLGLIKGQ